MYKRQGGVIAASALAVLVLILVCTYVLMRRHVFRPLEAVVRALENGESADQLVRRSLGAEDEIGSLVQAIAHSHATLAGESQRLERSQRRVLEMVEGFNDPIFVLDRDLVIRYVNRAVSSCFGYPSDELLGTPFVQLLPDSERESFAQRLRDTVACVGAVSYTHLTLPTSDLV